MLIKKSDIAQMIAVVKVHYPHNFKNFSSKDFELLVESWFADLKEFKHQEVYEAFCQAKLKNKISITTADILEQIERKKKALEPTAAEQWAVLENLIPLVKSLVNYEFIDTYKKEVEESYQLIFEQLGESLRVFTGGIKGLKELSLKTAKDRSFEKVRFLKDFDSLSERVKFQKRNNCLETQKTLGGQTVGQALKGDKRQIRGLK